MWRVGISFFGLGYWPWAPGTAGSAAVTALVLAVWRLGGGPGAILALMLALAGFGAAATVLGGRQAIKRYGPDPGVVVSDEVCGQALTFLGWWALADWSGGQVLVWALLGLGLFRLFDIVKPAGVRRLERLPQGWGILLDDVLAGVYANILLQVVVRLGLGW